MRAVGSRISADGREVTVYLRRSQSEQLLGDIAQTGEIAVVFSVPSTHQTLQLKAEAMRQFPDVRIRIEGHADERGTVEYNLALGERRAEAARAYLIDLGIDPDRMTTISYGEERPAVQGSNEAAWSQNRRDEFIPLGG